MNILILIILIIFPTLSHATSWKIDDLYTFTTSTNGSAGIVDADSVPTYRIYEDETGTAVLTGSMAKLDDAGTTGFYSEQVTLSAANGFEKGKSYNIIICAAISSTTACATEIFQVEMEVDSNTVSGTVPTVTNVTNDVGITQAGADKAWSTAVRVLTAGTNIALAKGTGVTGFNDLSTTQVNTEVTNALNTYDPPTRTEATADKDAILARTPSATAITNINAAYDGTGYAGQAIKVVIATTTETWNAIPLVETGVVLVSNDHNGKWLWCGLQKPKKIVKTVQGVTDTVTVAPGDPFSPTPSGLTCYIN